MMLLRRTFVSGRRGSSTTSVQCSSRNINFSNHIQETAQMFRTTRILYSTAHFQASDRWSPGAWRMAAALLLMLNALVATSWATVVDFSDLSPSTQSPPYGAYWNGSDGSGGFTSGTGSTSFNNSYNLGWQSWTGWSYSNVNYTDTSAELDSYSNPWYQYAAVTGTGVGGSANYAVAYGCSSAENALKTQYHIDAGVLATITIPDGMKVQSAMVTNTTWAVASMLNGDWVENAFGPNDWFKLTITGENASGTAVGSVDFWLAKGTGFGTLPDYLAQGLGQGQGISILNTWQSVNLSSLSTAKMLVFDFTSSSTDPTWGMNTPAYAALGSLTLSPVPEPSTVALLCVAGVTGAIWLRRRRPSL